MYKSTLNKDIVRKEDMKLVFSEFKQKNRKLRYFGMPSGDMKDILTWKKFLSDYTAVEIDDEQVNEMALTAYKKGIINKLTILRGNIDDIILNNKDRDRNMLNSPFDIVFLDYFGGVYYRGLDRINAIKTLFKIQKPNNFVLLMTINLIDKGYYERIDALGKIQKTLSSLSGSQNLNKIKECIEWYKSKDTEEKYRQKIYIPYLLKTSAEIENYKIHCYAPIFYKGFKNSPMLHFRFKAFFEGNRSLSSVSDQSVPDLFNLRLKISEGGRILSGGDKSPEIRLV
jgi:hypothetical protein